MRYTLPVLWYSKRQVTSRNAKELIGIMYLVGYCVMRGCEREAGNKHDVWA